MAGETLALLEMLLVFGLVLGFAVWQLVALRRVRKGDGDR
jgi:hypothetical protein